MHLDISRLNQKERDLLRHKKPDKNEQYVAVEWIKEALVREMKGTSESSENKLFRTISRDAKYDFLKNIMIGDTNLIEPERVCCVTPIKVAGTNRFIPLIYEMIEEENLFDLKISITESSILYDGLKMSDTQQAILKRERLLEIIYNFSKRLLEEEITFFENCGEKKVVEQLRTIDENNDTQSPVLRVGGNEGFLSLTIGLLIKDKDPDLYGQVIAHTTKNKSYNEPSGFPKTRRLADYGNNGYKTIGWLQLSTTPLGEGVETTRINKPAERMASKSLENGLKALKEKFDHKKS